MGVSRELYLKARIQTYADEPVTTALTEKSEGVAAARRIIDMTNFVHSRLGELNWSLSEQERMKDGSMRPIDTDTYQKWEDETIETVQTIIGEHSCERADGDVRIEILRYDWDIQEAREVGLNLVSLSDMRSNVKQAEEQKGRDGEVGSGSVKS